MFIFGAFKLSDVTFGTKFFYLNKFFGRSKFVSKLIKKNCLAESFQEKIVMNDKCSDSHIYSETIMGLNETNIVNLFFHHLILMVLVKTW